MAHFPSHRPRDMTFELSTSVWGHGSSTSWASFLPIISLLRPSILDVGSCDRRTDWEIDNGHQRLMPPPYPTRTFENLATTYFGRCYNGVYVSAHPMFLIRGYSHKFTAFHLLITNTVHNSTSTCNEWRRRQQIFTTMTGPLKNWPYHVLSYIIQIHDQPCEGECLLLQSRFSLVCTPCQ